MKKIYYLNRKIILNILVGYTLLSICINNDVVSENLPRIDNFPKFLQVMSSKSSELIDKALKESRIPILFNKSSAGFSNFNFVSVTNKFNQSRLLLLFSWKGPPSGYIFLVDMDGNIYDTVQTGFIKSIRVESLTEEVKNNILIIDVIKNSGTGARDDHFIIFDISNDKLNPIFNETSYALSFPGPLMPDENYELNATLYFELLDGNKYLIYEVYRTDYRLDTKKNDFILDKTRRVAQRAYTFNKGKFEEIKDQKILNLLFFSGKE
ncbi:MAG: hypothetical protein QXU40_03645 [Candidatus Pacearchaeota archaeon]